MWRFNLVLVAACFFAACEGASVADTAADSSKLRIGNTVRYYRSSWDLLVSGEDMVQIANPATDVANLGITATTQVAVIVHGRESGAHTDFGDTLKFSLATANSDLLIILVDWAFLSFSPYDQAAALVPYIAQELTSFISLMVTANLNLNNLHLIGFDLGAHIVGIASRPAATKAIKITALDPAGSGWTSGTQRLRPSDATYVEVIHTDITGARAFGLADAVGTLDIYPNGGTRQPGCAASDNACHHERAWRLFDATVNTGGHLLALRCDSMTQVNNNRCVGTPAVLVGTLSLVKLQSGLYRVNTGNTYPFNA